MSLHEPLDPARDRRLNSSSEAGGLNSVAAVSVVGISSISEVDAECGLDRSFCAPRDLNLEGVPATDRLNVGTIESVTCIRQDRVHDRVRITRVTEAHRVTDLISDQSGDHRTMRLGRQAGVEADNAVES